MFGENANQEYTEPPERGDPLVGVSLCGNSVLLGVTDGYVTTEKIPYVGCGVEIYMTVPAGQIGQIYEMHQIRNPTELTLQPWGDLAFEVKIGGYLFMIATQQESNNF